MTDEADPDLNQPDATMTRLIRFKMESSVDLDPGTVSAGGFDQETGLAGDFDLSGSTNLDGTPMTGAELAARLSVVSVEQVVDSSPQAWVITVRANDSAIVRVIATVAE